MDYIVITSFHYKGHEFKIVKDEDGWYCGVDIKYLDNNHRTTKKLNGFELGASKTIEECITHLKNRIDVEELISQGVNRMIAVVMVHSGRTREDCENDKELMELAMTLENM